MPRRLARNRNFEHTPHFGVERLAIAIDVVSGLDWKDVAAIELTQ